jgi:hypothetical protein
MSATSPRDTRHVSLQKLAALAVAGAAALAGAFSTPLAVLRARADVLAPVDVRVHGGAQQAQPGKMLEDVLIVTSRQAGEVTDLRLAGEGWSISSFAPPAAVKLAAGEELSLPFAAIPSDPQAFLVVTGDLDGWPFLQAFQFSADAYALSKGPLPARRAPEGDAAPVDAAQRRNFAMPQAGAPSWSPAPAERSAQQPQEQTAEQMAEQPREQPLEKTGAAQQPGAAQPQHVRNIRVHGRFGYNRSDGRYSGGDAVTMRVLDDDSPYPPDLLAIGITDAFGFFDITFLWNPCPIFCDGEPDLTVEFALENTQIQTTNGFLATYTWRTGITVDYDGTDLDIGAFSPPAAQDNPAVHIHTDLVRTWRWLQNQGYGCPFLRAIYPVGATGAFFNGNINVGLDRAWREDTHSHEYGHHFMNTFAINTAPTYCNGICDTPNQACGHCMWCRETDHDAFNEGMPNWLADIFTRQHQSLYGYAPLNFRSQESVAVCGTALDDPLTTEGFLGALLRDIEDDTQDDDPLEPLGIDGLALGPAPILACIDLDRPTTPAGFLTAFRNRYGMCEQLWATAANCGYTLLDQFAPGSVSNLASPSHDLCFSCADPSIQFTWNRAGDDCSGVAGYSVVVAAAPTMPDQTQDIGDVTSYTTGNLPAGSYWFSIRAVDRAGRWSPDYNFYGPATVRPPEPANLGWVNRLDWAGPVVPRPAADGSQGFMPAPLSLTGGGNTWYNVAGYNFGNLPTSTGFAGQAYVDGRAIHTVTIGAVTPFTEYFWTQAGPVTVQGGRHTFGFRHDALDQVAESNENDNAWARQWVWTPLNLTPGMPTVRPAPPNPVAGWEWIRGSDPYPLFYNCDGLRYTPVTWWSAVVGQSVNPAQDIDLMLASPSTGANNGFGPAYDAYSGFGAGVLEAVIVNGNTWGWDPRDVGVINGSITGTSNYRVVHTGNGNMAVGDSIVVSFAQDEMLKLWEIYIPGPDWYSVGLDLMAAGQPFTARWLEGNFTAGALADMPYAFTVTPAQRRGHMDHYVYLPGTGFNCVVLSRDPRNGTGPATVALEVERSMPDLMPSNAGFSGWYAALVPRPAPDGTLFSVPAPTSLPGDVASTYFNLAVRNQGPVNSPGLLNNIYADGSSFWWITWDYFLPNSSNWFNWGAAWSIGGGRHTLSVVSDPANSIEESDESNNVNGQQWVWTPSTMPWGTPVTRYAPLPRTGGWSHVTTGEPLLYNCDGVRTPVLVSSGGSGSWNAVAIMPSAGEDVDVELFELSTGAKNGFDTPLVGSDWGSGQGDYVLVNLNTGEPSRAFDAGAFSATYGSTYTAQAVKSTYVGASWQWPLSLDSSLGAGKLIELWDFLLLPGGWTFQLENLSGTVDWGLTLHTSTKAFQSKSDGVPGGTAFLNGPGQGESFTVNIPQQTWGALAVWKATSSSTVQTGSYRIRLLPAATDVSPVPAAPITTMLASIHPNPFNPRTTIAYDLAREGPVTLRVLNVRGALVRTLQTGLQAVGRHQVEWDGHDDTGRPVSSGVYIVQLEATGTVDRKKAVLVK